MGSKEYKKWIEMRPKVGLLRPKTMPKHFLHKSETTLKKSRNRLFWPPKWPKMTPQNGQNEQNFVRKFRFSGSFINLSSCKYTKKLGLLRPKTKPKHFVNNFKTILKKSRIRLFWAPKWSNMTISNVKSGSIFDKSWFSKLSSGL